MSQSQSPKISLHVIENGPLKVSADSLSVHYCGEPLSTKAGDDVFLCRCGQSANAPFCDGSHQKTTFETDTPAASKQEIREWKGRTITTYFNPNACMHVFYCKPLKALRNRELDGEDVGEEIAAVVQKCPSGALSFEAPNIDKPLVKERPDLDIREGGEIRVQREFEINADLNERQENDRATLCRCGLSANKPYCDGGHKRRDDSFR